MTMPGNVQDSRAASRHPIHDLSGKDVGGVRDGSKGHLGIVLSGLAQIPAVRGFRY
ncbi:hypothetical protein OK016_13020 [Vibrio chagasii]|nr:hypothetical protein [Vibrio chagasii]